MNWGSYIGAIVAGLVLFFVFDVLLMKAQGLSLFVK